MNFCRIHEDDKQKLFDKLELIAREKNYCVIKYYLDTKYLNTNDFAYYKVILIHKNSSMLKMKVHVWEFNHVWKMDWVSAEGIKKEKTD